MNDPSLIPDEYVADRVEVRRTFVGVILFVVVMVCVISAFFFTNRQWDTVRARQAEVKVQHQDVSTKIARMEQLRAARDTLVERAELTSALVSHVPRSYLLAGLVDRMPPRLSWTSLVLTSTEIKVEVERPDPSSDRLPRRGPAAAPVRTRGANAAEPDEDLTPKKFETKIVMTGIAPDEVDVSMYVAALQEFDLLRSVMPDSTEIIEIGDLPMRKFKLTMYIDAAVEDSFEMERVGSEDFMASDIDVAGQMVVVEQEEN